MIEIEVVIIIVIAIAVWLFIHFRKKSHESAADSSAKPVSAQAISTEPEPEVKMEPAPAPIVKESIVVEASEGVSAIPEDSTLRRHYLQNLAVQCDRSADAVSEEAVVVSKPEDAVSKVLAVETGSVSSIPEDRVLKRHFIQQLTAEIAAAMPDRPADSTLKRHYDAQLLSLVHSKLQELK